MSFLRTAVQPKGVRGACEINLQSFKTDRHAIKLSFAKAKSVTNRVILSIAAARGRPHSIKAHTQMEKGGSYSHLLSASINSMSLCA